MIRTILMTSAALLAIAATPALAQQSGAADEPAEIIVTAQKRSENIQDVPVAVSVVTADALARQGAINIEQAQYLVPSLNFRKSGLALNQSLYIRGVGTTTFSIGGEPSVGTVLDGVVLSRAGEAFSDLVDIERIEVLRGPQGTLFGKNASAGVVSIVSKRPGKELGGFVEGGWFFGNGNEYRVRGAVDLPLSDTVRSRVTGFYTNYEGNIFNAAPNVNRRVNGWERYGVRGIVEADASEKVKLTIIADWRRSDDDCCAQILGGPAPNANGAANATFLAQAAALGLELNGDRTRTTRQNQITRGIETSWGISGQIDAEVGSHTLTSITAYRGYDANEIRDGDFLDTTYVGGAGFRQSHDLGPQTGTTFTQEIRLTSPADKPFTYVVGAFFSRADQDRSFTRSNIDCTASTLAEVSPGLRPCSTAAGISTFTLPVSTAVYGTVFTNYAAFGQARWQVTEKLRLLAGLRFTADEITGYHSRKVFVPGASNGPFDQGVYDSIVIGGSTAVDGDPSKSNGIPFTQKADATNLSGMGGLQYDFSDDIMGYATYARGYKGPGLNLFFNLRTNGTPPLAPELGDSFEAGLKTSLFDKKLIFNVAAFYAKYRNFQANNPDFVLGQRVTRFSNAGTISTRGFEAEFLFRPTADFNLGGGLSYTDAKVDAFRLPAGGNAADLVPNGTQLAFAPKWKGSLGGNYTVRTGGFADVQLGMQSSWQSSQISLFVGNPLSRSLGTIRPYALVDLSVALVDKNDKWRLSFVARNIFDKSFAASIADGGPLARGDSGLSSMIYIIPREADRYFGLQGRINF